ncbi:hypothetical protein GCM10028801_12930 [Nocardioides maradonensis]
MSEPERYDPEDTDPEASVEDVDPEAAVDEEDPEESVDEVVEESFPSSDPPSSWAGRDRRE